MSTIQLMYYKLNTKEDPYFIHKALGIFSLVNFGYRYYLLFFYGSMFIHKKPEMLLVHAGLSVSSLIFHIPKKRHATLPMIYPEFRLHSIVFALRSVICCFIHLYVERFALYYKMIACFITMLSADLITKHYFVEGDTTMRAMPYSTEINVFDQRSITYFYSYQQISATLFMLFNSDSAFSPLFAIQIAAFLMTLVRKNIISPNTWHICYSLSLLINIFILKTLLLSEIILLLITNHLFILLRFTLKINKYISWACIFCIFNIYLNYLDTMYNYYLIYAFIYSYIIRKLYILSPLYFKIHPILKPLLFKILPTLIQTP
jgi:hypothetical protein